MVQLDLFGAGEQSPAPGGALVKSASLPTPAPSVRHVVLVGCGAAKLKRQARARDLYTGSLFVAARRYAEQLGDDWRILSARHWLVKPEQRLKPYNYRLPAGQRVEWARKVAGEIHWQFRGQRVRVTILAGEDYAAPLAVELERYRIASERPLQGLGVGKRLAWFKARREVMP